MHPCHLKKPERRWTAAAVAALVTMCLPVEASAQSLFEALFGGRSSSSRTAPQAYADPGRSFDPFGLFEAPRERSTARSGSGTYTAYCVRLCDGRYFPIARNNGGTPAQLCSAMCPATKTKIFSGSQIAHATASDGSRYDNLDSAYLYREQIVPDCTCNGKDGFGLAPVDVNSDPTLKTGDIVATSKGLMAFQGAKSKRGGDRANYTPIDDYSRLSRDLREKLANTTVVTQN